MTGVEVALLHGAGDTAAVWSGVRQQLAVRSVAPDLLGRGRRPFDLSRITLELAVEQAVADIEAATSSPLVLVAHSIAGALSPGIIRRLAPRVIHLVHIAAVAAANGQLPLGVASERFVDLLASEAEALRSELSGRTYADADDDLPCGLRATKDQTALTRIDSLAFGCVPTSWTGVPPGLPRTFAQPVHDRLYPADAQQRLAAAMAADEIIKLDGGHNVARSRPALIAGAINGIVERYR